LITVAAEKKKPIPGTVRVDKRFEDEFQKRLFARAKHPKLAT